MNIALHTGVGSSNRIALVHGFSQSGGIWAEHANALEQAGFEIIAPDLPGHGATDEKFDDVDLWEAGRLLVEACGRATYVGYSLGARTLLHAALQSDLVEQMVLIGANAGYRDAAIAARRARDDDILAGHALLAGIDTFIDEWMMHPVNSRLTISERQIELRKLNRVAGLAASLLNRGVGKQESLWERLPSIDVPALVMCGELDTPVISATTAKLAEAIGLNASYLQVAGVGHSVPFEAETMFLDCVIQFVSSN